MNETELGRSQTGCVVKAKPMKNGRLYVWQEWESGNKLYKNCLGTYGNEAHAMSHPLVKAAMGRRTQ